jgi:hypothetical protein
MNLSPENEYAGVTREEEVSINQIFGKMTKILQTVTERRGPRGEDEALERFLKFQLPIFVGRQKKTISLRRGWKVWKTSLRL